MAKSKLLKVEIKNCKQVRNHPELKKFAGMRVIAQMTAEGILTFSFALSTGLSWPFAFDEVHSIAPHLVNIIQ